MGMNSRPSATRMTRTPDGGYLYRGVTIWHLENEWAAKLTDGWHRVASQSAARQLVDNWLAEGK